MFEPCQVDFVHLCHGPEVIMKIIAQINDGMVLCEVSSTEIAQLHGASSVYDSTFQRDWLRVGTEHDLAKAINTLDAMRKFDEKELNRVKSYIEDAMKTYEQILDQYHKVMLFDTLKNIGQTVDQ